MRCPEIVMYSSHECVEYSNCFNAFGPKDEQDFNECTASLFVFLSLLALMLMSPVPLSLEKYVPQLCLAHGVYEKGKYVILPKENPPECNLNA